jgi:hypothetical protein
MGLILYRFLTRIGVLRNCGVGICKRFRLEANFGVFRTESMSSSQLCYSNNNDRLKPKKPSTIQSNNSCDHHSKITFEFSAN